MLGDQHLRLLTITGFPNVTVPGVLDELNDLGFEYRWTTRWISLDKPLAQKQLTRLRRQWFSKRKSIAAILREVMFNQESALVDTDAENKAIDADEALQELGSDDVSFGYVTTDACRVPMKTPALKPTERLQSRPADHSTVSGFVSLSSESRQCRGGLAWNSLPGTGLRQCPPADRSYAQPDPHDAGLGGLGRTVIQSSSR